MCRMVRILRLLGHSSGIELLARVGVIARVDVAGRLAVLLGRGGSVYCKGKKGERDIQVVEPR
jgi:hypothetical protein